MHDEPKWELGGSPDKADAMQAQILLDQWTELIDRQDYPAAAINAQQAIDLVPNQPEPYLALAETMSSMENHEHAVEAYDEAYQRSRPDKRYETLKGRAYNKHYNGDYTGAIEDLTEMIALKPEEAQIRIRRGISRGEVADYQGAIDDFDKAVAITGFSAYLHNLLAHAHMYNALEQADTEPDRSCESAEKALRHFKSALGMDPLHRQANEGFQMLRTNLTRLGDE